MIFRPSGGLKYHLRARLQKRHWRPFAQAISQWLEKWQPPTGELLLFGPSAGYSLPRPWLKKFSKIDAFDLDPLAPWFFKRDGLKMKFHAQDLFFAQGKLSLKPLREVLQAYPSASILFCNVLGQVPLEAELTEEEWHAYLLDLRQELTGRRWASYHDLYTLEPLPRRQHEQMTARFARQGELAGFSGTAVDHGTRNKWSAGLNKSYFGWSLTSKSLHLIEGVQV